MRPLIVTNVDRGTHLMTEESHVYTSVGREFNGHSVVNHLDQGIVATGGYKHSNTAENYFSIFKRGVIGTYHHMSEAHLGRYLLQQPRSERRGTCQQRPADTVGKSLTYRRTDTLAPLRQTSPIDR